MWRRLRADLRGRRVVRRGGQCLLLAGKVRSAGAKGQSGGSLMRGNFFFVLRVTFFVRHVSAARFTGYLCPSSLSRVGTS